MYNQLADLEELLYKINDEAIRAYTREAIASYQAGANRSAIVSIWIAVIYDLYQKTRYLAEQFGDKAAKECIEKIDQIRSDSDKRKAGKWEETILDDAYEKMRMITSAEYTHLQRIRQDRHYCVHPALDREGLLFQPSPEVTRAHLRTAIDVLLSQPALIGKAASQVLINEVESAYFPDSSVGIAKAVNERLLPGSEKYRADLFKVCLKKILYLLPEGKEQEDKYITEKYILVFKHLLQRFQQTFAEIDRIKIKELFERTLNDRYSRLLELLVHCPSLWMEMPDYMKEKLQKYTEEKRNSYLLICIPEALPEDRRVTSYKSLNKMEQHKCLLQMDQQTEDKHSSFYQEIVQYNIDEFVNSSSFALGRFNANNLILPIISWLNEEQVIYLIEKLIGNDERPYGDQCIDCVPQMLEVFAETFGKYNHLLPYWERFVEEKSNWGEIEDIASLVEQAKTLSTT